MTEKQLHEKTISERFKRYIEGAKEHGDLKAVKEMEIAKRMLKDWAIAIVKEIDRIFTLVPPHQVNVGSDKERGACYVSIYDLLQYKTRSQSEIWLKHYEENTGKSREILIEELKKLADEINQKREEHEKAMKIMGFEREFEDFGDETFLHINYIRKFLIEKFELKESDLK